MVSPQGLNMNQKQLRQILESELVKPFIKRYDSADSELTATDAANQNLPSGIESWLDDWHDPHQVGLKNFNASRYDAKTIYYTALSHLMGSNPYMPVVYNINQFGHDDNSRMEFKLERLIPFKQADLLQMITCLKNVLTDLGDDDDTEEMQNLNWYQEQLLDSAYTSSKHDNDFSKDYTVGEIKEQVSLLYQKIVRYLQDEVYHPGHSEGYLRQFIEQLDNIVKSARNNGINLRYDLHSGNFMFRRTKHGLQLVVTDPLIIRGKK